MSEIPFDEVSNLTMPTLEGEASNNSGDDDNNNINLERDAVSVQLTLLDDLLDEMKRAPTSDKNEKYLSQLGKIIDCATAAASVIQLSTIAEEELSANSAQSYDELARKMDHLTYQIEERESELVKKMSEEHAEEDGNLYWDQFLKVKKYLKSLKNSRRTLDNISNNKGEDGGSTELVEECQQQLQRKEDEKQVHESGTTLLLGNKLSSSFTTNGSAPSVFDSSSQSSSTEGRSSGDDAELGIGYMNGFDPDEEDAGNEDDNSSHPEEETLAAQQEAERQAKLAEEARLKAEEDERIEHEKLVEIERLENVRIEQQLAEEARLEAAEVERQQTLLAEQQHKKEEENARLLAEEAKRVAEQAELELEQERLESERLEKERPEEEARQAETERLEKEQIEQERIVAEQQAAEEARLKAEGQERLAAEEAALFQSRLEEGDTLVADAAAKFEAQQLEEAAKEAASVNHDNNEHPTSSTAVSSNNNNISVTSNTHEVVADHDGTDARSSRKKNDIASPPNKNTENHMSDLSNQFDEVSFVSASLGSNRKSISNQLGSSGNGGVESQPSPNGSSSPQNSDDEGNDGREDNDKGTTQEDGAGEGNREGIITNVISLPPTRIAEPDGSTRYSTQNVTNLHAELHSEEPLETKTDALNETPNNKIFASLLDELPPTKAPLKPGELIMMTTMTISMIGFGVCMTLLDIYGLTSLFCHVVASLGFGWFWGFTGGKMRIEPINTCLTLLAVTDVVNTNMELPITLFAPSDDAFLKFAREHLKMPWGPYAKTMDPIASLSLAFSLPDNIRYAHLYLTYHIVDGLLTSDDLTTGPLSTLNGGKVDVVVSDDGVKKVHGATITHPDALVVDGLCVVHIIDKVLCRPKRS